MTSNYVCQVMFNGYELTMTQSKTVTEFVAQQAISGRFIVVLNDQIIPKSGWQEQRIEMGDTVEIISPISGG